MSIGNFGVTLHFGCDRVSDVHSSPKLWNTTCVEVISMIKRFMQEEEGQTLVEYGLLISLIALVVIAVLTVLGRKINTVFNVVNNALVTS